MNLSEPILPRPRPITRALLIAEVVFFMSVFFVYIWLALPAGSGVHAHEVAFGIFAVAFPIGMNLLHGDHCRDSGIRGDNLGSSFKAAAIVTVVMAAGVVALGLAVGGFHWVSWKRLWELVGGYLLWGIAQQYLLQAFALRRLLQAGVPTALALAASAALFGMLHAPNWALVGVTTGAGVVWCVLFLRKPNIFALGVAHAVLGVLLFHAWPQSWMQNLTIGPVYVIRAATAGH